MLFPLGFPSFPLKHWESGFLLWREVQKAMFLKTLRRQWFTRMYELSFVGSAFCFIFVVKRWNYILFLFYGRVLYGTALRLLCKAWETNDRIFGSLHVRIWSSLLILSVL